MLDDRVRAVLERLELEDSSERERGLPPEQRARQVEPTTGRFLFSLVAPQTDCEVLELGGSRGYSSIWLAAGVRNLGGRVLSLERDPAKIGPGGATSRKRGSKSGRTCAKETRSSSCC
jgi:predicted O-methyltransferase YrrM